MIGFYEDDLRFLIALCREHCAVLRIEFREAHGDPAMQQAIAREMQQARRCARKLKRVIGEADAGPPRHANCRSVLTDMRTDMRTDMPTPHADALIEYLRREGL